MNWKQTEHDGYLVSDCGAVEGPGRHSRRILKPFDGGKGYLCVLLATASGSKNARIHTLVARAFLGLRRDQYVAHKDGNKKNNNCSNLVCVDKGYDGRQTESEAINRFWSKVDKSGECWQWRGSICASGYGNGVPMSLIRKYNTKRIHRVSLLLSGVDVPRGMDVDHMCRNRACVNPNHLRVVTRLVNSTENNLGPAALNKVKRQCKWGHEFNEQNTIVRIYLGRPRRECRICKNLWHMKNRRKISTPVSKEQG